MQLASRNLSRDGGSKCAACGLAQAWRRDLGCSTSLPQHTDRLGREAAAGGAGGELGLISPAEATAF